MAIQPTSIREAAVLVIQADSLDQFAESIATVETTSTTFQDGLTLTFTPSTIGDYLIISCADVKHSETTTNANVQLDIDGVAYTSTSKRPNNNVASFFA